METRGRELELGLGVIVAAVGATLALFGHRLWGFLALAAGLSVALGYFTRRLGYRLGGAALAAGAVVAALIPFAVQPPGRVAEERPAPPTTAAAVPTSPTPAPADLGDPATSEPARRAIFQEAVRAEARASEEAEAATQEGGAVGQGINPEKMVRRAQKREKMKTVLTERYRREVAERYRLGDGMLAEILQEGRAKGW